VESDFSEEERTSQVTRLTPQHQNWIDLDSLIDEAKRWCMMAELEFHCVVNRPSSVNSFDC
jgi:hypothetical protein